MKKHVIEAKQYLLNNYAQFNQPVNLNYSTKDATFKLLHKYYNIADRNLLKEGEILYETIYLSNDPAQKGWFTAATDSYLPPTPLGDPAPAQGIGRVLISKNKKFQAGEFFSGMVGWVSHNIVNPKSISAVIVDISKVSKLSDYLSVFGGTTLTAYLAAFKYSGIHPEDEGKIWLISGAAGGLGSALAQIVSKLFKPKLVLAIAGGSEKARYVESLGPNIKCVDYKSKSYNRDFRNALNGELIDVFVDQVGGSILNRAILHMRPFGRIVQSGAISGYNEVSDKDESFYNYPVVITKRLSIKGFVVLDHATEFSKIIRHLNELTRRGTLDISKFEETVAQATDDQFYKVPDLWNGIFEGVNKGKYITQVSNNNSRSRAVKL
ncbi:hypothetical protein WICPIJ_007491 [Wickerhamomyces pijperi]|uniref:Enoyl reductase (ER) domain-containing protein n=1 Tax=Wickerhamomyces pijperi TaxID=599730 RepID=A0A9P8TKD9_WICPI|nr:hypothetical protein WICPIJ_007491 [Wickerhamomyces pijperi]